MAANDDIGIDLGTANTLIYMKGKGIVLREPSVMAVDVDTNTVMAIGSEAYRMIGRTPRNMAIIYPLKDGTITDFRSTEKMLHYFVRNVVGKRMFGKPACIMCLPAGATEMERRSLITSLMDASVRSTRLLDKPLASALGAGLDIEGVYGSLICDIGGGVTDISVISMGHVIVGSSVKNGGYYFDDAIIRHLRLKHNLLIGERTAEELKIHIGAAVPRPETLYMEVTGRHLVYGLPKTMRITSEDIQEALEEPVSQLIESIHAVLEHTPAELASDIFEDGITLTGAGSLLFGLEEAVADTLKIPCKVAEDPASATVMGAGMVLENMGKLSKYLGDGRTRNFTQV